MANALHNSMVATSNSLTRYAFVSREIECAARAPRPESPRGAGPFRESRFGGCAIASCSPARVLRSLTSDVGDSVPGRIVLQLHLRATLGRDANKVGGASRAPYEAALARVGGAAGAGPSCVAVLDLDLGLPGRRHAHHIPVERVPPDVALPIRRGRKRGAAVAASKRVPEMNRSSRGKSSAAHSCTNCGSAALRD